MSLEVKNKRLKMSPNGVITLPVSARKALGMTVNKPADVSVKVSDNKVILSGNPSKRDQTWSVSKKGMFTLKQEAKKVLENGEGRHYWLDLDDKNKQAVLVPY